MGHIRQFLPQFWPLFRRCFAVLSRCPASWRQDGENAPKTAENGRKMAEIVVSKHPVSYVYSSLGFTWQPRTVMQRATVHGSEGLYSNAARAPSNISASARYAAVAPGGIFASSASVEPPSCRVSAPNGAGQRSRCS